MQKFFLSFLLCFFLFVNANVQEYYDKNDNLVKKVETQLKQEGSQKFYISITYFYDKKGVIIKTKKYQKIEDFSDDFYSKEEIWSDIDKDGDEKVSKVKRYLKETQINGNDKVITQQWSQLNGNSEIVSFKRKVEKYSKYIDENNRTINKYELFVYDQNNNMKSHYKKVYFTYIKNDISINQIIETFYDADDNVIELKVTKRYSKNGKSLKEITDSFFDEYGNIKSRKVTKYEKYINSEGKTIEIEEISKYKGSDEYIGKYIIKTEEISTEDKYEKIIHKITEDKYGSIVSEKTEKYEETKKIEDNQNKSTLRKISIKKVLNSDGKITDYNRSIEEEINIRDNDKTIYVYHYQELDDKGNILYEKFKITTKYLSDRLDGLYKEYEEKVLKNEKIKKHIVRRYYHLDNGEKVEYITLDEKNNEKDKFSVISYY